MKGAALLAALLLLCPASFSRADAADERVHVDRMLVRVFQGRDPTALRWLLAPARIGRLGAGDRSDLVAALLHHRDTAGLALAARAGIDFNHPIQVEREGEMLSVMPLSVAIALPDALPLVRELLRSGADPNRTAVDDPVPLVAAAGMRAHGVVAALLDAGAKADVAEPLLGATPLMALLAKERDPARAVATARLLLARGANVNAVARTGQTALINAVSAGNLPAVQLLLDAGADLHAVDEHGRSALRLAEQSGDAELLRLLRGADKAAAGR